MKTTAKAPSNQRVSLPKISLLLAWIATVLASFREVTDNSFLWHVTAGGIQRSLGEVLTTDPFSFTVGGSPWLTQSWLIELAYSLLEQTFGIGFVAPMLLVTSIVTVVCIGAIAYRRSESVTATALVLLLSLILLLSFLVPRPVLFSYPLFALVILAWDRPGLRWATPFLMWTWASVHGSFAIGLLYIALMTVRSKDWRQAPTLLAASVATLLTAHGLGVVDVLLDFLTAGPYLDLIQEWRTPDFLSLALMPFLLGIVILMYGSMRGRLATSALWTVVPFMVLGMMATRSVAIAWIGLLPDIAASLRGLMWRLGRGFSRPIAAMIAVLMLAFPWILTSPVVLDPTTFPIDAAASAADVRTFHDDSAGGYLIYAQAFGEGVFIDDRAELYRERIVEFVEIRGGVRPWEPVFERDGIKQAILRVNEPLIDDLRLAGWSVDYEDVAFVTLSEGG